MKKKLSALLAIVLVLSLGLIGCAPKEAAPEGDGAAAPEKGALIGVAMPTKSLQRWIQDGDNMKAALEEKGYEVDLQYPGDNDVAMQISQIENMITKGCKVLVIASIDGGALGDVLAKAAEAKIPVIAYDRLITGTPNVDYYATFDNYMVGTIQGEYIKKALDLDNAAGPFNMEAFAGSPDDNNARFFYQGAVDVLKPYIDAKKLVVKSGQLDFEKVAIPGWGTKDAQARMDNLLSANYADGSKLDLVLSPNDSLGLGVANALDASGDFTPGKNWPVITGQDCDVPNVLNMIAGKQSMSVFKDTRTLAAKVVEMVDAIVTGGTVPVNNTDTYDNGEKVVPSFLCEPVFADKENFKTLLLDSGYYTGDNLDKIKAAAGL